MPRHAPGSDPQVLDPKTCDPPLAAVTAQDGGVTGGRCVTALRVAAVHIVIHRL